MASTPLLRKKNQIYQANINKRGHVKTTLKEEKAVKSSIPMWAIALFAFALFGGVVLSVLDYFF
ncbi:hypothetical protein K501DRAFT_286765 [Backusella circina FSU 941]|nr:hypothetical protein K501DRAFT_286765 [Backusella circina FSU 941]